MTPGRGLAALATVGILLLSACSTAEPDASEQSAPQAPTLQRSPHPAPTPLPEADTTELWLPHSFEGLRVLDPGWDTEAQYSDGVFLGATDHGDHLEYTAVDLHGEVLWAAERPSGSTGFSIRNDSQGHPVAVLPDVKEDGTGTVSAYDLASGELVWGPAEPPGPAAPEGGGTTTATGAEHDGNVDPATGTHLALEGTTLRAHDPEGTELWTLSVSEGTTVAGLGGGFVYLREGDAIRAHNVMTGAVAQAYDPEGQGRVVVPKMIVSQGAALLLDGERQLIATAPAVPQVP